VTARVELVRAGSPEAAAWLGLVDRVYPDRRFRGGQARHEAAVLAGRHPLSAGLELKAFLALDRHGSAVGRCAVSRRADSPVARLGFFECAEPSAAPALFAAAEAWAAGQGCAAVRGPFDPDYWVGYRLKLDHFDVPPFFGEPYNRPEYPGLWEAAGYEVVDRYQSNVVLRPRTLAQGMWSRDYLLARVRDAGVTVRPMGRDFGSALRPIHELVMDRFAVMPEFHPLSFDQFAALMGPMGSVLNRQASQLAWSGDKLVGFAAAAVDFGRSLEAGPVRALTALAAGRLRPRGLIASYMAVDSAYRGCGLGAALALASLEWSARRRVPAIGSLIHEGAPTARYLADQVSRVHHYALYEKPLT
jgi:GNAT superfamily N-acetyltransferase